MATTCIINFCSDGVTDATIYRHWDGYPESVLPDLQRFFNDVKEQTKDTRFDDSSYLAAKFVVWQAGELRENDNPLNFLGLGVVNSESQSEDYKYYVNCDCANVEGFPIVELG